jgi:oligopeptidase B
MIPPATFWRCVHFAASLFAWNVNADARFIISHAKTFTGQAVRFEDPAYSSELLTDQQYESSMLRYVYQSPRQTKQWIEHNMGSNARRVFESADAGSGYAKENCVVERIFATATDGAKVPLSILRARSTKLDGKGPLLMHGYGSYGDFVQPVFAGELFSLIDRG